MKVPMPWHRNSLLSNVRAQSLLVFLFYVGLATSPGCNGGTKDTARLTGEVTLDGQALPSNSLASVTFQPRGSGVGRPVTAEIAGSRYECNTVPKGEVVAQMSISIPTGRTYRSDRTGENVAELENVVLAQDQARGIPLQVSDDANVNFELKRTK